MNVNNERYISRSKKEKQNLNVAENESFLEMYQKIT